MAKSSQVKSNADSGQHESSSAAFQRTRTFSSIAPVLIVILAILTYIFLTNPFSFPISPSSPSSQTTPITTTSSSECSANLIRSREVQQVIRDSLREYSSHSGNRSHDEGTLSRLKQNMQEYSTILPTGNCDPISPPVPADPFVSELPFELLDSMVSHRSNLIKSQLRRRVSDVSEKALRAANDYDNHFLRPLQLFLDVLKNRAGPPHLRVLSLTHTQSNGIDGAEYNLLEYAVDRNLVFAFHVFLSHFPLEQQPPQQLQTVDVHQKEQQLNVLQLAENNHDEEFIQWLKEQSALKSSPFQLLMQSRLTAAYEEERAAVFSAPNLPGRVSKNADSGGWRSSAADVSGQMIAGVEDRGCPFTRVKASELTLDRFVFLLRQKQPIIITDALSATGSSSSSSYSIVDQFRRRTIANTWANVNASASAIPYGNVFGIKDGAVSFEEFLGYLDSVYEKQTTEGKEATTTSSSSSTSSVSNHTKQSWISNPPFYIFDSALLEEFGWNPLANVEKGEPLQYPPRLKQLPALPKNFFQLPEPIRKVFMSKFSVMQFYLGSEGSGAPFHYHCPALNALVYGKKNWWFYPPSIGYYSKRFPLQSLLNPRGLPKPYRCDQHPGELLYVPQHWSHATINRQESIGVAVEIEANGC